MDEKIYDVIIVGGGPSGATAARYIDKKYSVLLIDKKSEQVSNVKEKCCGGLLAPDAQEMLAKLNVGIPKDVLEGPQIFSVKTLDYNNDLVRYYQRYYININRAKFDRWLLSLVNKRVEILYDSLYKSYIKDNGQIKVTVVTNKKETTVKCRILIGADGAISKVRENLSSGSVPVKYISIQKWYETDESMPYYISIFDKEVTDFYSWVIKKDNQLVIGSAIKGNENANEKFEILVKKLKNDGYDIGKQTKKEGTIINRTRKINQIELGKDNVALIGEAAGLISPSSAEGISYALKSGYYLAKAINKDIDYQHQYVKSMRKLKLNILLKNIKIPFMYHNMLRKIIMKLHILSIKINP